MPGLRFVYIQLMCLMSVRIFKLYVHSQFFSRIGPKIPH